MLSEVERGELIKGYQSAKALLARHPERTRMPTSLSPTSFATVERSRNLPTSAIPRCLWIREIIVFVPALSLLIS